jgi:23S rRNA pseudouridine2605 synthase
MAERIQKRIAASGLTSRRQAERWIAAGRVTVNGRPAALGDQAESDDTIAVDGRPIATAPEHHRVLAYYKPEGELCTRHDPQGRATVFDRLPDPGQGRWILVGRLDANSRGLLLFTTDGDLANALMHPSRQLEREYRVRVRGRLGDAELHRLEAGVELEDGPARFTSAERTGDQGRHDSLRLVITEGRKREVRRALEALGHPVTRLLRVRYGPVSLPRDLAPGAYQELDSQALSDLARAAGLEGSPR